MRAKYNDYPFDKVVAEADQRIKQGADVYQKFTCQHCGARQTMADKNVFFTRGICEECGKETDIKTRGCNYMMHIGVPVR